jgi:glucokinase
LVDGAGHIARTRVLACDDYAAIDDALAAYLGKDRHELALQEAALAVASPVTGDAITLTNHPWSFTVSGLRRDFALERLLVVNDFTANALAMPHIPSNERLAVGGGTAVPDAPIGVLGPGSGLGVSGLVPISGGWVALRSEGGHATMAPADERESVVLDRMRRRFDHVSAERVLSGPGLVNLYNILAEIEGVPAAPFTPAQIADRRIGESDALAREALAMFCAMLGTAAGNLALILGARGGIYIAGGIVPRLGASFAETKFRERFEAKGRFHPYLAAIPTCVVTHPIPAFLGLIALLDQKP